VIGAIWGGVFVGYIRPILKIFQHEQTIQEESIVSIAVQCLVHFCTPATSALSGCCNHLPVNGW
jgi:hypothetical protein